MEITIAKEKDFPLLGRKRVVATMQSEGATPSRLSLTRRLGTLLKAKEENIAIRHVFTKFGTQDVKIIAHVYKDAELKKKVEEKHVDARMAKQLEAENKAAEEKKKAAEEAKAAAAEAPAEESAPEGDAPAEEKPAEDAPKEEKPAEEAPKEAAAPAEEKTE